MQIHVRPKRISERLSEGEELIIVMQTIFHRLTSSWQSNNYWL